MSQNSDIVISGISGRFPECEDIDLFKEKLYNKENLVTYDSRKWPVGWRYKFGDVSVPCGTGKLSALMKYDASVFAVSPMLASQMDAINRMVLEPSFEAILDAGINPSTLMGANVGCYLASGISEIESIRVFGKQSLIERMGLIGCSKAMLSNRVSFALNLGGPSHTLYHGVLGGFAALSTAYEHLKSGHIDAAIVGAAANVVDPKLSLQFVARGFLSPDALCRAFDADANGYGRSEGVVIMYLQRADDAKRNYGTLLFSESLYYGINSNNFNTYDEELLRKIYKDIYAAHKNVNPSDVSFFEMDAFGVKSMDETECNVIEEIFCQNRKEPLLVGSVKTTAGHAETTAGYFSLVKALFALDSDEIAPNMHFNKPNPNIKPLMNGKMKVVTETTKLPGPIVAVNSLSVTGELNHAVLKQNPKIRDPTVDDGDTLPRLMILCGRSQEGLTEVIKKVEAKPLHKEFVAMTNDIFKTLLQSHYYRGYTILPASANTTNAVEIVGGDKRPIWFVFSGMGSQWNGMGKGLLDIPLFAETVDKCDQVLRPRGIDIRHILTTDDTSIFDNILHSFVGIITVQVALVNILKAIGIEPDGMVGHSVGENGCAYADGCLSLEQAVLASYARGVASLEVKTIKGMMAAIGRGYNQIKDSLPEGIEVACHNSVDNCTLTGPVDLVNEYVEKLQNENIFARAVNVGNIAYHSKHIVPAAPKLMQHLKEVITNPKERSAKWISSSVPEADWQTPLAKSCSAEYLTNNLVSPVLFEEACKHIPENAIVIEIAPHGLLQAILKRSLSPQNTNISMTLRSKEPNAVNFLLASIGKMFIAGCQPDVNALYPAIKYPVPRGTPSISTLATWDHTHDFGTMEPMRDRPLSGETIQIKLSKGSTYSFIAAHEIQNRKVIPTSLYMYLTWHIFSLLRNEKVGSSNIVFEEIRVRKHVYVTLEKGRNLLIMIHKGSGNFEVLLEYEKDPDNPKVLMSGIIKVPFENVNIKFDEDRIIQAKNKLNKEEFYEKLRKVGYKLEDEFVTLQELSFNDTESRGTLKWNENWVSFLDGAIKSYMYADGNIDKLLFPSYIRQIAICTAAFETLKKDDDVIFIKDEATRTWASKGVEIIDMHYSTLNLRFLCSENTVTELLETQFVSHSSPNLQSVTSFLDLCLQLAVECSSVVKGEEAKLNIVDVIGKSSAILKNILRKNTYLKSKVIFSKTMEFKAGKFAHNNSHMVIVDSISELDKLHPQLKHTLDMLFVLVISSSSDELECAKSEKLFIPVSTKVFDETTMCLLKKIPETNGHIPPVVAMDENWPSKLSTILKSRKDEPVILLRQSVELSDLQVILSKRKKYPNLRCMYIMDDNAPQFSSENPIYRNQIMLDLPVAVLKDGQWGSYRTLAYEQESKGSKQPDLQIGDYKLKEVDLQYICADLEMKSTSESSHGFEYSGITESGKRKMGLARYQQLEPYSEVDEDFSWQIPRQWSFEDASTVPYFYIQAYQIIFLQPIRNVKHSFLLNCDNLSFTEAFIAVCLHHGHQIYVTVSNEQEANLISQRFPQLNRSNLLERKECKYEIMLRLLTKGEGAEICVNTIRNMDHVTAMLNCTRVFGHYVDMTDRQYKMGEYKLGMISFLKSLYYSTAPNSVSALLRLPAESKKKLHQLLETGMKEGVVKPLTRHVVNNEKKSTSKKNNVPLYNVKILHKCYNDGKIQNSKVNGRIKYDENRSFLIISGGKKTKLWFELVEWLISRGAKKFVIALDNFSVDPKVSHQINRLLIQKKATIILTTSKKAECVQDATDLIAEANNVAPLEAIFFVSLDPAGNIVANLDTASRNDCSSHFICLFSGGLKECERRRRDGLPAVLIHSEQTPQRLSEYLQQLETTLELGDDSSSLYQIVDKTKRKEEQNALSFCLSSFMSLDSEKLENIGYSTADTLEFVETTSLSLKYNESKNLYPIFVIPHVNSELIAPLTSKLDYPTFCATFTEHFGSATEAAERLFESLTKIQPGGPITVIGDAWNGCVGIELAALLQKNKRQVELMLVDGNPADWKNHLEFLGDVNSSQFNQTLLKEIFSFAPKTKRDETQTTNSDQSWNECLEQYVNTLKCPTTAAKMNVIKAVNGIRERLVASICYSRPTEILNHITLFKRHPSNTTLGQYTESDDVYLFVKSKYEDFIKIREIREMINKYALVKY